MKKSLKVAALCAAYGLLTIGAAVCPAQTDPIAGGYGEASPRDAKVIEAANFAVAAENKAQKKELLKLVEIRRAEQQVVAGLNFRLCLAVSSNGTPQEAGAVVYLNLKNQFSLSSWTAGKCAGDDQMPEDMDYPEDETVTYQGSLQVGKTDSVILYLGEESGDYAAFCFKTDSEVGRAILAKCKEGEQCEFTGTVDGEAGCQVKGLEADLSFSGQITSVESVRLVSSGKPEPEPEKRTAVGPAPDVLIKDLYASEKNGSSPFFQTKNRALVDRYFDVDLADLIWEDAVNANGEVGALDFDPLYNAQDTEITAFMIGKPEYEKAGDVATVTVSFKNFGKAETVQYFFYLDETGNWKCVDVVYSSGDSLKDLLFNAKMAAEDKP